MGQIITTLVKGDGTIRDNLHDAMQIVPLKKSGYFADKSNRKSSKARVLKCSDPIKTAFDFFSRLSKGNVSLERLPGEKGCIAKMKDGGIITFRHSSASDGSPIVEIRCSGIRNVKDQKIHFVSRG